MAILDIVALKAKIDNWITTNGNREITGIQMNEILKDLIDSGPNFISNAGSIGLADYVATETYNENGEGQVVIFDDQIYQAKDGELNITGVFDPLKWDLIGSAGGGITDVNGDVGPNVVLDTDDISDAAAINKYVSAAEKSSIASALQSGDNVSSLVNDAGYLTTALQSGDNISELVNDAGYVTSDTNLGNTDQTLTANRDINQGSFDLNFDGRSTYGSGFYTLDSAIFVGSGYATGIYVDGNFSGRAAQFNNSGSGEALRTSLGDVRLAMNSGNVGISGFFDTQFKLNIEAGATLGGGVVRSTASNLSAWEGRMTGTGINRAFLADSQNGTTNTAYQSNNGDNKFNSASGSTGFGESSLSALTARVQIKGETSDSSTFALKVANSGADILDVRNDKIVRINNTGVSASLSVGDGGNPFATIFNGSATYTTGIYNSSVSGTGLYLDSDGVGIDVVDGDVRFRGTAPATMGQNTLNTDSQLFVTNADSGRTYSLKTNDKVNMTNLPTSSAGLAIGDLWNNSGVINIKI